MRKYKTKLCCIYFQFSRNKSIFENIFQSTFFRFLSASVIASKRDTGSALRKGEEDGGGTVFAVYWTTCCFSFAGKQAKFVVARGSINGRLAENMEMHF